MLTSDARHLAASLHAALAVRHADTAAHCRRVSHYAVRLFEARTRGNAHPLDRERREVLEIGGLLHDVGKLFIPTAILDTRGTLTRQERHVVQAHPVTGESILGHSDALLSIQEIVRHHHERWDGTGYPDGRRGLEIPYLARIVSVVDVFDALTSVRSYRQSLSYHEARAILLGGRGTQFDPDLLDAWADVPAAEWQRLGRACCEVR